MNSTTNCQVVVTMSRYTMISVLMLQLIIIQAQQGKTHLGFLILSLNY
jgi:hypothetical protein